MVNYDIHCTPKPVGVSVIRLYKQSSPCSILWGSNHNSILKIITQMRSEHKDRHQNGSKSHLLNINHLNKIPDTGRNEVKHQRLSIYKVERKMNQKTSPQVKHNYNPPSPFFPFLARCSGSTSIAAPLHQGGFKMIFI